MTELSRFQLKHINRRAMLHYIRKNPPVTKSDLAKVTGLTFMAINKIFAEMEALGLIRKDAMTQGGPGRNAATYTINEQYGYTIGIHINAYRTAVALLDLHGTILYKTFLAMEGMQAQDRFVEELARMVRSVIENGKIESSSVFGIGIGSPGPVDTDLGVILMPPNIPLLHYLPLKQALGKSTGLPVFLHKDTNAIALGEYWHGMGKTFNDLVYLDIDMGIGGGLVFDGKVRQGSGNISGEIGHLILQGEGPQCNCGNRGCLEAMSSALAILRDFSDVLSDHPEHPLFQKRNSLSLDDLLSAMKEEDMLVVSLLHRSAYNTGIAVRSLINMLGPQLVILGGLLVKEYPRYFDIVRDVSFSHMMKGSKEETVLKRETNADMGLIGSAEIVADHFFEKVVYRA